jgi:hypothetical protein
MSSENATNAAPVDGIVMRLRDYDGCHDGDIDEAADMLEFFFGQMQMHSPKMDGQHSYRFRGGWQMTHCRGPNAEDAVRAAIREIRRELDCSPVVRVSWRDGEPYIAIGDVYEVGTKKRQRRVNERGGKTGQQLKEWSSTLPEAFDREIQWWANYFCVFFESREQKREMELERMESAMCQLRRLRRKLQRHGLM